MNFNITLLPGDGIGPEVVGEAVRVLETIASKQKHSFKFTERRFEDAGVAAIIFTDIARDGLLKGLNLDATIALAEQHLDSGDRLRRACLDRRRQGAAQPRAPGNSPARSPAARSMTAGSTPPPPWR